MVIRSDFSSVSLLLNRLVEYAKIFVTNNNEHWSHLKNKEDFRNVYDLPSKQRWPLEEIYSDGRDIAVGMSARLTEFNDAEYYPTLKSYVDSFAGGSVSKLDKFRAISQEAKDVVKTLQNCPWAVTKMIELYDRQINLLVAVSQCLDSLKATDLYKWESGLGQALIPVAEYKKILDCVHSVGKMFERLPATYNGKDEEALRDHILVSLETAVAGSATGETFNKKGKTDILVRGNGSNEFVGECKFWRGKEVFHATIDQLLGYLTWRDNKAAIIIFVDNKDFSAVVSKAGEYTKQHSCYLRELSCRDETWLNFEFRSHFDASKVVQLAVMLYHIPG